MEILSSTFYLIVTIGILVVIHEFGHYIAAVACGMRAEVFAVGMGKRLFGWNRKNGFTFGKLPDDLDLEGNTDFRVAMFPIGGYVKISGMIDESLDTEFLKQEPQSWEFRSKPRWQRAIVLVAGVVMNLLLAVIIFWGIIYHKGKTIRPVKEIGAVAVQSTAEEAGFKVGDTILSINDHTINHWDEIESTIYTESVTRDLNFSIQRSGSIKEILVQRSNIPDLTEERFGICPVGEFPLITIVDKDKPAGSIGLEPGDIVTAVNGIPVGFETLSGMIRMNKGKEIIIDWMRDSKKMSARVTPNEEGMIGVALDRVYQGATEHEQYGFFEALPVGVKELKLTSVIFISNIYQLVAGKASLKNSLGGPVTIARMARQSAEAGVINLLGLIGLLSLSLAFLNVLPFPALDGGHLLFLGIEAIIRREIPSKIKIAIQQAGFFLLLVFMAYVLYNDLLKL